MITFWTSILLLQSQLPTIEFRYSKPLPNLPIRERTWFLTTKPHLLSGDRKWITSNEEQLTPRYSYIYSVQKDKWTEYSYRSAFDGQRNIYGDHNTMARYIRPLKTSTDSARLFHYRSLVNCASPTGFYVLHNVWSASINRGYKNPYLMIFYQNIDGKNEFVEPLFRIYEPLKIAKPDQTWIQPSYFMALDSKSFIASFWVNHKGTKAQNRTIGFGVLRDQDVVTPLWTESNDHTVFILGRWPKVSKYPIISNFVNGNEVVLREMAGLKARVLVKRRFNLDGWRIARLEPYREYVAVMLTMQRGDSSTESKILFCDPKDLSIKGELFGEGLSGVSPDGLAMILISSKTPYQCRLVSGPITFGSQSSSPGL